VRQLNNVRSKALTVRGTEFWMGSIDGHHGGLKGKVRLNNRAGAVTLSQPEYGTDIGRHREKKYPERYASPAILVAASVSSNDR
jgi:hypothetical protein